MEQQIDILSKGVYRHSYIKNFIYPKYYMFVRKNNKKYLSIRFENGSDTVFDSVAFTVMALDSSGDVIERIPVTYSDVSIKPGESFTNNKMVRVKPECSDFKVVFDRVYSGDVVYSEQGGHAIARYAKKSLLSLAQISSGRDSAPKPIRKRGFLMAVVALLAVVIIIGANFAYILGSISAESERRREERERLEEQRREEERIEEENNEDVVEEESGEE